MSTRFKIGTRAALYKNTDKQLALMAPNTGYVSLTSWELNIFKTSKRQLKHEPLKTLRTLETTLMFLQCPPKQGTVLLGDPHMHICLHHNFCSIWQQRLTLAPNPS